MPIQPSGQRVQITAQMIDRLPEGRRVARFVGEDWVIVAVTPGPVDAQLMAEFTEVFQDAADSGLWRHQWGSPTAPHRRAAS